MFLTAADQKPQNLIKNALLTSSDDSKFPDGWKGNFWQGSGVMQFTGLGGKKCFSMTGEDEDTKGQLFLLEKIPVQAGQKFTFDYDFYISGNIRASVQIRVINPEKKISKTLKEYNTAGKEDWQTFSGITKEIPAFSIPEDITFLTITLFIKGKGTVAYRNLLLVCQTPGILIEEKKIPADGSSGKSDKAAASAGYAVIDVKHLTPRENELYKSSLSAPPCLEMSNGVFYKNGKPVFLFGTINGSRQFELSSLWYTVLHNFDFTDPSGYGHFPMKLEYQNSRIEFSWTDAPWFKTMVNEAARMGIYSIPDLGSDHTEDVEKQLAIFEKHGAAGAEDWYDICNTFYGHFYVADVNSGLGREFLINKYRVFLKYLKKDNMNIPGVELFNELGYFAFTRDTRLAFQSHIKAKYSSLDTVNSVFKTAFTSFDQVLAPHLWKIKFNNNNVVDFPPNGENGRLFRKEVAAASKDYPELFYEWLDFLRQYFASGYGKLYSAMKKEYSNIPLTLQARCHQIPSEWYSTVDIEQLEPYMDFFSHMPASYSFYSAGNSPLDEKSVKTMISAAVLRLDFISSVYKKPVINAEFSIPGVTVTESSIAGTIEKAVINLHTRWKYKADPQNLGASSGWHTIKFSDSSWDEVMIPNFDHENQAREITGICWYRLKFIMPAGYLRKKDYDDERYILYGKGLDDSADIFINDKLIFSGGKWSTEYSIDISEELKYGGENTLVYKINNKTEFGGIRNYAAIIEKGSIAGKSETADNHINLIFWENFIHGYSGLNVWTTSDHNRIIHPAVPQAKADISSVMNIAGPRPRIRGEIGMLYPYEDYKGLLWANAEHECFNKYMNYYCGALFNQIPLDLLSCRQIIAKEHCKYSMVIIPYARLVRKGVLEALVDYVKNGGKIILTPESLLYDDYLYTQKTLPLELLITGRSEKIDENILYYKNGQGCVYQIQNNLTLPETHALLKKISGRENIGRQITLEAETNAEFPYIETQLIGNQDAFIVYMMNWGSMPQKIILKTAPAFIKDKTISYNVYHLQKKTILPGNYNAEKLKSGLPGTLLPLAPAVLVFENKKGLFPGFKKVSEKRTAILQELKNMGNYYEWNNIKNKLKTGKASVVFIDTRNYKRTDIGVLKAPMVAKLLITNGYNVYSRYAEEIKSVSDLAGADALFITEDFKLKWARIENDTGKNINNIIQEYIAGGGGLFIAGIPEIGPNNEGYALRQILGKWKINPGKKNSWFSNPGSCQNGDPLQVIFTDIQKHEITAEVKKLCSLFAMPLDDRDSLLEPLIRASANDLASPGLPVLLAGEIEKGRVAACGDTFFMQPFRIDDGDNAKLVWNILCWLTKNKIEQKSADEIKKQIWFNEEILDAMEKDER